MDVDTVRLLKTQDLGYLRTMRNIAAKDVRDLEERYILAGGLDMPSDDEDEDSDDDDDGQQLVQASRRPKPNGPRKIVFCDGVEERDQIAAAQRNNAQRRTGQDDEDEVMSEDDAESEKKQKEAERKARNLERLETKLRNAKKKLKALSNAEYELELQKAKMAKTATSGGITKTGRKIKVKERKR